MAKIKPEFDRRNVKVIGLSVTLWAPLAVGCRHRGDAGLGANYPIIGDADFTVRNSSGCCSSVEEIRPRARRPTIRRCGNVFVVGPDKKVKLIFVYPMTTGRNFDEVLRVIDSLQLTAKHKVATPVNWQQGDNVIIAGSVSDDEAKETYPDGWESPKPYIRIVEQPS